MNTRFIISILCVAVVHILSFGAGMRSDNEVVSQMTHAELEKYLQEEISSKRLQVKVLETRADTDESEEINVQVCKTQRYGELEELLGENALEVDSLVVEGPLGDSDFKTMWNASLYGKLKVINLEKAQIENNTIPNRAFVDLPEQLDLSTGLLLPIKLRRIILPESVENIDERAFWYATRLEEINIPSSLKRLGDLSFEECRNLKNESLDFPEGLEEIGRFCFHACYRLPSRVTIPSTVKRIGHMAFHQTRISSVTFAEGLESMGNQAFSDTFIEEAILPNSCVNFIGERHFSHNRNLKKIKLPEGLEVVPPGFLYADEALEEVIFSSTIKEISTEVFVACWSIKKLHFPEGLTTIQAGSIDHLYGLEEIVFPSTIAEVMHPQWDRWENIKRIYCKAQFPPDNGTNSAIGMRADGEWSIYDVPFYIPKGCTKNYTAIGEWSSFRNYIETDEFPGGSSVETIKVDSENDGPIYDLMGRRVSQPMKGTIYIQNGKKFVCK